MAVGKSPSASWRVRMRVRWRRQALTEALAVGADPRDTPELALLARRLTRTRTDFSSPKASSASCTGTPDRPGPRARSSR
jgi:hypothetical protein